ncbi:MAG TPA: hypothetical protein VG895_02855 [Patescibacteria group bacterium]|nr:hypothetical protein [Patescibacteria group bacterium]
MNIKTIGEFGEKYVGEFLVADIGRRDEIKSDWYEGLKFFFSKSFYRGRKDEISENFQKRAMEVVENFDLKNNIKRFKSSEFEELLVANKVNNRVDRRMICQTIEMIRHNNGRNIVLYSIEQIHDGNISGVYQELCNIYGVADKIATFFLRDLALVFELENEIKKQDFIYFQPIDTWVKQVSDKLGVTEPRDDREVTKSKIINKCLIEHTSPLLFNAGAWYVGKHSFDILLNYV